MKALALLGSALAGPPAVVADVVLEHEGNAQHVVLTLTREWQNRALGAPSEQRHAVTTALQPRTQKAAGVQTLWLTGHGLSQHETPGDTLVTYVLLLEVQEGDVVRGYWFEDHMEVPTSLWTAAGTLRGVKLELDLTEVVDANIPPTVIRVNGLLRRN